MVFFWVYFYNGSDPMYCVNTNMKKTIVVCGGVRMMVGEWKVNEEF